MCQILNLVVKSRILLLLFEKFIGQDDLFLNCFVLFGLFSHILVFQFDLRTLCVQGISYKALSTV